MESFKKLDIPEPGYRHHKVKSLLQNKHMRNMQDEFHCALRSAKGPTDNNNLNTELQTVTICLYAKCSTCWSASTITYLNTRLPEKKS